jgi:hypothetical protein
MSDTLQVFKLSCCQTHPYILLLPSLANLEQSCANSLVGLEEHFEEFALSGEVIEIDCTKRYSLIWDVYINSIALF